MIPDDIDNQWNYTLLIVEEAEVHKAALDDFVLETPILQRLRLSKDHWKQLSNIKKVLALFKKYTEQVSKNLPSIYLMIRIYFELDEAFTKMILRQGEFVSFDSEVVSAIEEGRKKFNKYFNFMKENDIYYIASVLDP